MPFSPQQQDALLDIARATIRERLSAPAQRPAVHDPAFDAPAGCFVTLHELHAKALRGCVGRLMPEQTLLESVRAMSAGVLDDPRFVDERVTLADLPNLALEISVLSPMKPAKNPMDFDPLTHGIYLNLAGRTGCFLPQVARETGWTREQLLDRLCTEKMSLPAKAWRAGGQLSRFACEVIGPQPFQLPRDQPSTVA